MRLTMKAIIRWEQLNQKPFSTIDYSNEDDIISLFYVCDQVSDIKVSLDEFKTALSEDSIPKMIKDFDRQISLVSQFQPKSKKKPMVAENAEQQDDSPPVYIKDTVATLVLAGLDVYFAFNELELCDLPIFLHAYDQKTKDRLESQRFEIFWLLKPHAGDKIKTPQDLYIYNWEKAQEKPETQKQAEDAEKEFLTFMNSNNQK